MRSPTRTRLVLRRPRRQAPLPAIVTVRRLLERLVQHRAIPIDITTVHKCTTTISCRKVVVLGLLIEEADRRVHIILLLATCSVNLGRRIGMQTYAPRGLNGTACISLGIRCST